MRFLFLVLAVFVANLPAETMSVGVARVDITPNYPVRLNGFGFRRAESEGVTQKIWAKALVFADEKEGPAILIATDNLCVPDEITKEVASRLKGKLNLKPERLTITATHTHTAPMLKNVAPTLFGTNIPPEHQANIDRYTREFIGSLEMVALEAAKSVTPAKVEWAVGKVSFAANRRTKGGPVDHDLPMMTIRDAHGKLRAVWFSYACHCVTLSHNKISGDWAGYAQEAVEQDHPGCVAVTSIGCGADSNPSSGVKGDKFELAQEQGRQIGDEVKRLLAGKLTALTIRPQTRYHRMDLELDAPRTREEWDERAKRTDAVGHHARVNLGKLDRGEKLPTKINYPIQTWVFGDQLSIVFLPGETVVDYSLRIKRDFERVWVNGYSNDGRCYIPSERVLKEGGYEGGDAMIYYDFPQKFASGLEQKIIDVVAKQIPAPFKKSQ
jgi:hypothetical protein